MFGDGEKKIVIKENLRGKHVFVIGHGRSGPTAFFNGLRVIRSYVHGNVGEHIVEQLAALAKETPA